MPGLRLDFRLDRRAVPRTLFMLLILLLVFVAGCTLQTTPAATDGTTAAATTASATAATSAPTSMSTTTAATTLPTATVPTTDATTTGATTTGVTETRLGYVVATSSELPLLTIDIDYVEMYTGAEAIAKALEDGSDIVEVDEDGHSYIPNDYYIRNNNPLIRTFAVTPTCVIKMIPEMGGPEATQVITFAELQAAVAVRHRFMEIEVVAGQVVRMTEFYLP
jgi:hypothetical protein